MVKFFVAYSKVRRLPKIIIKIKTRDGKKDTVLAEKYVLVSFEENTL
jgi:hypothetical protein